MRGRRAALALTAAVMTVTGCAAGGSSGEQAPTPTPTTTPELSAPIELDYLASLVVDDGAGRALVSDWNAQKLRAIDATGTELWSMDTLVDDERGGAEAYSAGESVIVHDYSGRTTAYAWSDGTKQWSHSLPGGTEGCHPATAFASQSTGAGPLLGEGDLILLSYFGAGEEHGCEPTSPDGNLMVVALDPTTGEQAWPALSVGTDARTFGGTRVNLSPDRTSGYLSWEDGGESALTRIDLRTGAHASISLERARAIDDTGAGYYDVYPTTDPTTALYVYGTEDPDDPMSSAVTRAAVLDLPEGITDATGPVMAIAEAPAEATMEDTVDPVCAVDLTFTAAGEPTCVQPQLYASTIKYQGSTGGLQAWAVDAPEAALDALGFPGAPQSVPVDGPEGPLVIVPGLEAGIDALDAATGATVWSAGDPRTAGGGGADDEQFGSPWGGQGVLPELGLVVVTDAGTTGFYEAATGKLVAEEKAPEHADLTSGRRFVLVSEETSTTMWAVVDR